MLDGVIYDTALAKEFKEHFPITVSITNHTMAIFYAQTDRPNLTMEVVSIGKVTSNLSVFDTLSSSERITFRLLDTTDTGTDGSATESAQTG